MGKEEKKEMVWDAEKCEMVEAPKPVRKPKK